MTNTKEIITFVLRQFVLKVDKKDYPQVYLEQCKYKIKRKKPIDFINAQVDLSSDDSKEFR